MSIFNAFQVGCITGIMRYRRLGGKLPLLLSIHLIFYLSTTVTNTASDLAAGVIEQYGYSSYGFVPLRIDSDVVLRRRLRRQAAASTTTAAAKLSDEDDDEPNMAATRPPGIEDEDDNLSVLLAFKEYCQVIFLNLIHSCL